MNSKHSRQVIIRETEQIMPQLMRKIWGNGTVHFDTDSLDYGNPRDYSTLEWLSRIISGFVLDEREEWRSREKALVESNHKFHQQYVERDTLLSEIRTVLNSKNPNLNEIRSIMNRYKSPLEEHYANQRSSSPDQDDATLANFDKLMDWGFSLRDIARMLHVPYSEPKKWVSGEQADESTQKALTYLVGVCNFVLNVGETKDIVGWFETPLENQDVTPVQLMEEDRSEEIFTYIQGRMFD